MAQQSNTVVVSIESVLLQIGNECVDNFVINSPRSKEAMKRIGISDEDLWWKGSDEFKPSAIEIKKKKLDSETCDKLQEIRYQNHQEKRYRLMQSIKNLKLELKDEEKTRQQCRTYLEKILNVDKTKTRKNVPSSDQEDTTNKKLEEEFNALKEKLSEEIKVHTAHNMEAFIRSQANNKKLKEKNIEKMKLKRKKIYEKSEREKEKKKTQKQLKQKTESTIINKIKAFKLQQQNENILKFIETQTKRNQKIENQFKIGSSSVGHPSIISPSSLANASVCNLQRHVFKRNNALYDVTKTEKKNDDKMNWASTMNETVNLGANSTSNNNANNGNTNILPSVHKVTQEKKREDKKKGEKIDPNELKEKRLATIQAAREKIIEKNKITLKKYEEAFNRKKTWCPQQGYKLDERGEQVRKEKMMRRREQLGSPIRKVEPNEIKSVKYQDNLNQSVNDYVSLVLKKEKAINERKKKEEKIRKIFIQEKKEMLRNMENERQKRKILSEKYINETRMNIYKKKNEKLELRKQKNEKVMSEINESKDKYNKLRYDIINLFRDSKLKKKELIKLTQVLGVDCSSIV